MNKNIKAQAGVGTMLIIFIGVIFAIALLNGGIYQNVGTVTNTVNYINQSATLTATTVLNGQAVSNVIVTNRTSGVVVPSTNYSIVNYDVSTGTLRAYLVNNSFGYGGQVVNVSYTAEPLGYDTNAGGRAVNGLIPVFAALALIGFFVWKLNDDGIFDAFS